MKLNKKDSKRDAYFNLFIFAYAEVTLGYNMASEDDLLKFEQAKQNDNKSLLPI